MSAPAAAPTATPIVPRQAPMPAGRPAALLSGLATAGVGGFGVWLGLAGIFGPTRTARLAGLLPLSGLQLSLDPLGGLFIAVTGAVAVAVGGYVIGGARREGLGRVPLAVLPVFTATMLLVPAAAATTTFLFAWELMAVTALVLVLTGHTRPEARAAGLVFAVITQLGFVAILVALMLLTAAGGADRFADLHPVSATTATVVFVLTLIGFGSKAGLVPLHFWLPRTHAQITTPMSALMSAAMENLGVYGIIRIDLQLLGPIPRWAALTLLTAGAVSALYAVLQASVATDLKHLFGYSTTENLGLIVLALGAAALFADAGADGPATVATTAALLHLLAHAAFKSLGFLAIGSVATATGLRDLDRLGGLARPMPATTAAFGVAALGATGLPLGAAFVGEWLLIQSLMHAGPGHDATLALTAPLALGAVALTSGLGVAAMVKAFGIGFLARARTAASARAREASPAMLAGMAVPALGCAVLALAPATVAPALQRVLATVPATGPGPFDGLGAVVRLPSAAGSINPAVIAAGVVLAALAAAGLIAWRSARRPAPAPVPLWACGADELTARMQYTATSFAEPLQRVFDDVLRPETDIEVTHTGRSHYLAERIVYRTTIVDVFERAYPLLAKAVGAAAQLVRHAHTGSVHLYLAYGGLGVLIVLVVSR